LYIKDLTKFSRVIPGYEMPERKKSEEDEGMKGEIDSLRTSNFFDFCVILS